MTITRLTPEQARDLSARIAEVMTSLRRMLQQLAERVRTVLRALRTRAESAGRLPAPAGTRPARPAWMSPYGPPARRGRRGGRA